jgi:integrative and conjugative element protein (TIGR02256 family)
MIQAQKPQYSIDQQRLSFIIQESRKTYPRETGGILAGYEESGIIKITFVTGPGPKAVDARASFLRDGEYCQRELDKIFEQTNGTTDYLGEWHSHPFDIGPSRRDRDSLREISVDAKYAVSRPVMGLCIKRGKNWNFECYFLDGSDFIKATQWSRII